MLEQTLRYYVQPNGKNWDKILSMVEFAINNSHHDSIGTTPFMLNYGYCPRSPATIDLPQQGSGAAKDFIQQLQQLSQHALKCLKKSQDRMRAQHNRHVKAVDFNIGDYVLLKTTNLHIPGPKKFVPRFVGPFQIQKQYGPVAYQLELPPTWKIHPVFHVSLLKSYHLRPGQQLPSIPQQLTDAYQVHSIVGHDFTRFGKRLYLRLRVRYMDKSLPDTMELESDLLPEYLSMVKAYKASHHLY
jgi:hypothetical protein